MFATDTFVTIINSANMGLIHPKKLVIGIWSIHSTVILQ